VKKLIFFSKERLEIKMKKVYLRQLNSWNFTRIQKLKKMKKNYLKLLELHTMNLKILY